MEEQSVGDVLELNCQQGSQLEVMVEVVALKDVVLGVFVMEKCKF